MSVREERALRLAALFLLAALLRLLLPGAVDALRTWAEACLAPGAGERAAAWGRALAGEAERIAALAREGLP